MDATGEYLICHKSSYVTILTQNGNILLITGIHLGGSQESLGIYKLRDLLTSFALSLVQATYQFHPRAGEVEVWIHTDDSCLCTQKQGRFLSHTQRRQQQQLVEAQGHEGSQTYSDAAGGPPVEQLYAAHCVPESVWGGEAGGAVRYPLASLAAHATKFRYCATSSLSLPEYRWHLKES